MDFKEYQNLFSLILNGELTTEPYNKSDYLDYTKLNFSRQNRWLKTGKLSAETISTIQSISQKQNWILITEPWCGDASHIVPFIYMMAELNPLISLTLQLRDSENSEIDKYLTNGGRSIPMLIVRDENYNDIFHWGPRPSVCQKIYLDLKASNAPFEEVKITLQQWYNENKGEDIQKEICRSLRQSVL
jgi:hypothetical protein